MHYRPVLRDVAHRDNGQSNHSFLSKAEQSCPKGKFLAIAGRLRLKKVSPNNHFEALSWHVVLYGNAWFAARFGANQQKSSVGRGADAGPRSKLKLRRASFVAGGPASFP